MTYPAILFWLLLIWGVASRRPVLLYLFAGSFAFGTLTVIPPGLSGGVTLLPESFCAVFFFLKIAAKRGALAWMVHAALSLQKLGLLTLFGLVALISAMFFPHFFADTPVIPFRQAGEVVLPSPLNASAANITQTAYLGISILTVFATAFAMREAEFRKHLMTAILIGAFVTFLTGIADLSAQTLGLQALLTPFRNATYSLLTDDDILGAKRVVGLMPEASSYGPLCVTFASALLVLRPYYPTKRMRLYALLLTFTLLLFGWLSTSSTALLCLALFGGLYGLDWCRRARNRNLPGRASLGREFTIGAILLFVFLLAVVFDQTLFNFEMRMINHLVFDKTDSTSYAVRSTWNRIAWHALLQTDGIGVGVGGTRTSNAVIAVLSTTGVVGGVLFVLFLAQSFFRRAAKKEMPGLISAYKLALIVPLAGDVLTGTSVDFGQEVALLLGAVIGLSLMRVTSASRKVVPVARQMPASWLQAD